MKKFLVNILWIFSASIVLLIIYISRPQTIDISIPPEFKYCSKTIWGSNPEYLKIKEWLAHNKDGWRLNLRTHHSGKGYHGGSYNILVFDNFVAISYKTDLGFPQFTKHFKHGLEVNCKNES